MWFTTTDLDNSSHLSILELYKTSQKWLRYSIIFSDHTLKTNHSLGKRCFSFIKVELLLFWAELFTCKLMTTGSFQNFVFGMTSFMFYIQI